MKHLIAFALLFLQILFANAQEGDTIKNKKIFSFELSTVSTFLWDIEPYYDYNAPVIQGKNLFLKKIRFLYSLDKTHKIGIGYSKRLFGSVISPFFRSFSTEFLYDEFFVSYDYKRDTVINSKHSSFWLNLEFGFYKYNKYNEFKKVGLLIRPGLTWYYKFNNKISLFANSAFDIKFETEDKYLKVKIPVNLGVRFNFTDNTNESAKGNDINKLRFGLSAGTLYFNTPYIFDISYLSDYHTNLFQKVENSHTAFELNVTTKKFNTYSIGIMLKNKIHCHASGMSFYDIKDVANNFGIYGQFDHAIIKKWINNHINKPVYPYIGARALSCSSNFFQEHMFTNGGGGVLIDTNFIETKLDLFQLSTGVRTYSKGIFFDAGVNFNLVGFVNGNYKYSYTVIDDGGVGPVIYYYKEHKEFSEQLFFADFWRDKKIWKDKLSLCSLTFKVGYRF